MRYRCQGEKRRAMVLAHPSLNGIDDLEVLDREAPEGAPPRRTLLLRMLKALPPGGLGPQARAVILAGAGLERVRVSWALTVARLLEQGAAAGIGRAEREFYANLSGADRTIVVRTDVAGGAGVYRLALQGAADASRPPPGVDPLLAEVPFSFDVDEPAELDCARPAAEEVASRSPAPALDYLAKDYASFQRLMQDRLSVVAPGWTERNAADLGAAVVDVLAYAADHLSYFQDAVATEAYLGTARRRVSVRRHARLLDYPMHDGCNARVWVCLTVASAAGARVKLPRGTPLLTQVASDDAEIGPEDVPPLLRSGVEILETMEDLEVDPGLNEIRLYTWGEARCALPAGATGATLEGRRRVIGSLSPGQVLILEAVRGAETGRAEDADLNRRHAVRLTEVRFGEDPVTGTFAATGSLSVGRKEHAAVLLGDGTALIIGGVAPSGTAASSTDRYHPAAGQFSRGPALRTRRKDASATVLPDGSVLVAGGVDERGDALRSAERHVPGRDHFDLTGALAYPRYDHTATLLPDGRVLVVGGTDSRALHLSAELYDPAAGSFMRTGSLGVARRNHTATLLPDGRVLIAGGLDRDGAPLASAELYDPERGTFTPSAGPMRAARRSHTATLLDDGSVLLAGGSDRSGTPVATTERFIPATGEHRPAAEMRTPRRDHTATLLDDGRVLIAGGTDDKGRFLADAEHYDPEADAFLAVWSLCAARGQHAAIRLDDGSVLVTGGLGPDGAQASAERYAPPVQVAEVAWAADDALPFPLPIGLVADPDTGAPAPLCVARGNVALADHGRTIAEEPLDPPAPLPGVEYRPRLARARVTFSEPIASPLRGSARASLQQDPQRALPAIFLAPASGPGDDAGAAEERRWTARRDLLLSDRFARHFVVETEDDGSAQLRFGDDELGRRPAVGEALRATYRVGNGSQGNIGADSIAHVVRRPGEGGLRILRARNPLPAEGGTDPESIERVRLHAPQAFRRQERAVTAADYAEIAGRHLDVQKAVATLRWTGSWHTVFVTVDRLGGAALDDTFRDDLRRFVERRCLLGYDVEIDEPRFVALDVALTVHVEPGQIRGAVKQAVEEALGSAVLPGGGRGFFHPDNFSFGQPVYLSQLVAAVMAVHGVAWVDTDDTPPRRNRFRRYGQPSRGERALGYIPMGRLEIARLDNDPAAPQRGRLELFVEGGL